MAKTKSTSASAAPIVPPVAPASPTIASTTPAVPGAPAVVSAVNIEPFDITSRLYAPKLEMGHLVHYVLGSGPRAGEHRAALVVRVPENPSDQSTIALHVFVDNENDGYAVNTLWRPEVVADQEGKAGNTWHWPESAPLVDPSEAATPPQS